ncbi:MAG: hypothetical protein M1469_05775 [Bacteroidetes bacterium]|nr:hypothetical protein [Bacteroidota bacterium]
MSANVSAREALGIGIGRAVKSWRLLLLFYAFNFILAAILSLPIVTIFSKDVSRSLVGSKLLSGFDYRWYVEFIHANGPLFNSLLPQMVLVFVLYVSVEVFFAGGFYSAFSIKKRTRPGEFIAKGTSSFFPLLAVTLIEIGVLVLLYEGNLLWASVNENASRSALSGYTVFRAELWRYGVVIVLFIVVNLISDFIRAAVTLDDDDFWSKIERGFNFTVKHPLSTLGVYLGCSLISLSIIGLALLFSFNLHANSEGTVLAEIGVGQIFILLRIISKLIFYASEAVLYEEDQIEVIKVKAEMLE